MAHSLITVDSPPAQNERAAAIHAGVRVEQITIAWMTNVYNFMDGSNGLAGGMTVIGFGFYAVAAWQLGRLGMAGLCAAIAAAGLGFLFFNWHPARICRMNSIANSRLRVSFSWWRSLA